MKHDTRHLMKFKILMRRLNLREYEAGGLLEFLWQTTAANAPRGDIGRFSNEEIAVSIGYEGDADELIEALSDPKASWLDLSNEYRLIVHDWPDHCTDSVHSKLAKQTEYFADGSMPKLYNLKAVDRERAQEAYSRIAKKQTGSKPKANRKETESRTIPYLTNTIPYQTKGGAAAPGDYCFLDDLLQGVVEAISEHHSGAQIPTGKQAEEDRAALQRIIDKHGEDDAEEVISWLFNDDHPKAIFWRQHVKRAAYLVKTADGQTRYERIRSEMP